MKGTVNGRPLKLEDLQDIATLSSAALSADGKYIVYVTTKVVMEDNDYRDYIHVVERASGETKEVWEGASPQWSPVANEIAYEAAHNGNSYIWIFSLNTGKKRPLAAVYTSHYFMGHLSLKNFTWSPDGAQIAYVSAPATVTNSTATPVKVIDRLLYKTKGGRERPAVTDNTLTHIWVVAAKDGLAQQVTAGPYNEHSICWSPDSLHIGFISNRSEDPDDNQLHDLWSVTLATGNITRHTENFGTVCQPAWSPDGTHLAFLATKSKLSTNDSPAEDTHLYIMAVGSTASRNLTWSLDRRVEQISWHPHHQEVYFTAGDRGSTAIYKVDAITEVVTTVTGQDCHILEYSLSGNLLTYIATDTTHLTEIFLYDEVAGTNKQLTTNSDPFSDKCLLQIASTSWFESFDGKKIQGWLMKPTLFDPSQQYPLILVIHGGPHNMFGYEFEDRMQLLSANGYGVLFINPRGSSGYGQDFSNGTLSDWGGGDYKDLMAGVDAAISSNSWIDATRLGVTGQSYGGYMTNRIITKTTRFKAAVADGSISNLVSFSGTSLYHSLMESEFDGSAYDHFSLLWNCSPLKDVKEVVTPTLLLHGETDNEVPLSQAEEMYIALKKKGVDSMFVQYTGEGHGWRPDMRPHNRYDLLSRMVEWFDKYLKR
ncbi:S9 family peptidase [Chitinophaga sp. MM2321]|uniref:S9 family peptidase n=1 Tax=Chitinophaga sp. MM2321 TaxID=3137178 RepID=UPI0032D594D3